MKKKILVIYYTQTGQLKDIVTNVAKPFIIEPDKYEVDFYNIQLKEDFPFPWPADVFFDTFPESYLQVPKEILPPPTEILDKKYDFIIFGYQVWYLTPSIPIISFLKSGFAEKIMKDTPIITVSGTRNMWMLSQEKLKTYFKAFNSKLVGNIALVDRHDNYSSVLTILKWLTTGNKKMKRPLPDAGVSDEEINSATQYGQIIKKYVNANSWEDLQPELVKNGAVEIRPFLVRVEKVGNKIFTIWSNLIMKNPQKRKKLVTFFKIYLMFAIWIISPIVLVFHILAYPILFWKRKKQREYFQGIQ